MKHFLGLLINPQPYSRVTVTRTLTKGSNLLTIFDVVENTNGEISCRWLRYGDDDIFGLAAIRILREKFLFREPYLAYATSLNEMDKFLETLNSRIPIIKVAINSTQKISPIRKEQLRLVLKREIEKINQRPRLERPSLSGIRYLFHISGSCKRYYPYPTYIYRRLMSGESLLSLFDTIENTLGNLTCRWWRVSKREFRLVVVIREGKELAFHDTLLYVTTLDEMDKFLEQLYSIASPTDSEEELRAKVVNTIKSFKSTFA